MKKGIVATLAVLLATAAAAGVPCKKCRVSYGNIVYRCPKGHIVCTKCMELNSQWEQNSEKLGREMAVQIYGKGIADMVGMEPTVGKCTNVNDFDEKCGEKVYASKLISDNRDPRVIAAEKRKIEQERQKALERKAMLEKEHRECIRALVRIIKAKDVDAMRSVMPKVIRHYLKHQPPRKQGILWDMAREYGKLSENLGIKEKESPVCDLLPRLINTSTKMPNDLALAVLTPVFGKFPREAHVKFLDSYLVPSGRAALISPFVASYSDEEVLKRKNAKLLKMYKKATGKNLIDASFEHGADSVLWPELYADAGDKDKERIVDHAAKTGNVGLAEFMFDCKAKFSPWARKNLLVPALRDGLSPKLWPIIYAEAEQADRNMALAFAAAAGDTKLADYLLEHNADPKVAVAVSHNREKRYSNYRVNPYHLALAAGDIELAKKLKYDKELPQRSLRKDKKMSSVAFVGAFGPMESVKYLVETENVKFATCAYDNEDTLKAIAALRRIPFRHPDDHRAGPDSNIDRSVENYLWKNLPFWAHPIWSLPELLYVPIHLIERGMVDFIGDNVTLSEERQDELISLLNKTIGSGKMKIENGTDNIKIVRIEFGTSRNAREIILKTLQVEIAGKETKNISVPTVVLAHSYKEPGTSRGENFCRATFEDGKRSTEYLPYGFRDTQSLTFGRKQSRGDGERDTDTRNVTPRRTKRPRRRR